MIALFESIGGWELALVGIGALLLFGKDLPRVAAEAGAQLNKLRRGLDSAWRDSGLEREVRQIRDAIPRDLSIRDVARTASEKLTVRLEEKARAESAALTEDSVARGDPVESAAPDVAPASVGPAPADAQRLESPALRPPGAPETTPPPAEADASGR